MYRIFYKLDSDCMVQFAASHSEKVSVFEVFSLRIHSRNCYQRRGWHLLYIVDSKGSLL